MNALAHKTILVLVTITICGMLTQCRGDTMTKEEIEKVISQGLEAGSTEQEIFAFMDSREWEYLYDPYMNRYQAYDPEESKLPEWYGRNIVFLYVNSDREFVRAEVWTVNNGI